MPQEILDAARFVMSEAVECHDVSMDNANPLADAVVMALLPWLTWTANVAGDDADVPERKWFTLRDGSQFFGTFAEAWRKDHPEEHTARHGLGMGSQDVMITCSCGQPGWVSVV